MSFRLAMVWALSLALACSDARDKNHAGTGGVGAAAGSAGAAASGSGTGGAGGSAPGGSGGTGGVSGEQGGQGGAAGGGGSSIDSSSAQTAACLAYVQAFCEWRVNECTPGLTLDERRTGIVSCVLFQGASCPDLVFSPGSTRTVASVESCAAQWAEQACEVYDRGEPLPCATPGTRTVGEPCLYGSQCAGYCKRDGSSECRACADPVAVFAPCEVGSSIAGQCFHGFGCDSASGACTPNPERMPRQRPAIGEPCDMMGVDPCDGELGKCAAGDDGVARCTAWPALGESCSGILECKPDDSVCDANERCVAWPIEGEPCVNASCAPDHGCDLDAMPPVCRKLPGADEPCMGSCASPFICMCDDESTCPTAASCKRVRSLGESCVDAGDICVRGALRCEGGVCVSAGLQGLFEAACGL